MKTLIGIPCMDMMHTKFVASLVGLKLGDDYEVRFGASSLVYDTRNSLLKYALDNGFDRIIQLDSDMFFASFIIDYLQQDLDQGLGIVTGLCFKRKPPYTPAIFDVCDMKHLEGNKVEPVAHCFYDYPIDSVFEVAACGGACVGMDLEVVKKIIAHYGPYLYMGRSDEQGLRRRVGGVLRGCD